jgi:hypothetical protein
MITCQIRYEIDADQLDAFERFARRWIALVNRSGGRDESGCVSRYERTFLRPIFDGDATA